MVGLNAYFHMSVWGLSLMHGFTVELKAIRSFYNTNTVLNTRPINLLGINISSSTLSISTSFVLIDF